MVRTRTLALVLAGGKGGRLESLTTHRAKPAVPYGGHHRLVDVALSNCAHSGIDDVWVSVQHNPVSLGEHLANGRPWDLDRNRGGMLVLHPRTTGGRARDGWSSGTADGLLRDADLIRSYAPQALLVVSADAVYRLDYDEVVAQHCASGATVTMVTTEVPPEDAGRYGVVQVDGGQVRSYALKPDEPDGSLVANEVFVFDPGPTLDLLEQLAGEMPDEQQDLGHGLLPLLVERGAAREHRFEGYWRDVGTVEAYHSSHLDLLGPEPAFALDDPDWPLLTRGGKRGPSRLLAAAEVGDVLLSPSATVAGTVERSVLSPGVVVEAGAVVRDSVLLHDTVVRAGASVTRAVLDAEVVVEAGAQVGAPDGELVLVGFRERVTGRLAPGGRQPTPG